MSSVNYLCWGENAIKSIDLVLNDNKKVNKVILVTNTSYFIDKQLRVRA